MMGQPQVGVPEHYVESPMWSNERVGYTSISILTRYEQWALAMDGGGIGFKFTNKRGAVRAGQQRGHWTTKLRMRDS